MNLRNQQWLDAIIPGTYDIIVAQAPECEATFTVTVAPTLTVTVTPSSGPPGTVVELDTGCRTVLGPQIQASDANGPIPELTWPTVSVPSAPPVLPRLTIPERPPGTIITFTGTCNAATLAPSTFTIPGPATTLPPTTAPPSVSPADAVRATPSFTG